MKFIAEKKSREQELLVELRQENDGVEIVLCDPVTGSEIWTIGMLTSDGFHRYTGVHTELFETDLDGRIEVI